MRNQYFQFVFRDKQAFLHFYPPQDGGEVLNIKEVTSYLEHRNYYNYDMKELNKAISNQAECEVLIGPWDGIEVSEVMDVDISMDKMNVVCRFYPGSAKGRKIDAKEIVETLALKGIRYGLKQQAIFDFLQHKEYCKDYLFCVGRAPVHGEDAKIQYFFNTKTDLQPKRNEDGSVDYKELNTISHVKKGDLLARLIPEDVGTSGKNVLGEEIKPRNVKSAKLGYGKNITISEDKTEIYSEVTGHALFSNGKVFVSNVYEVPADVDNSTGNIEYDGSVLIHGNVKSGFTVKAVGDIIVEGVVEGATIISEGQIIIKHGIHGMLKGSFQAGTNLMAKYIENATVRAGGYVEAEIILNSEVDAGDCIRVKGKKGLINGGTIRAKNYIEAENIGSDMGTTTNVEVGVDPAKKEQYIALSSEFKELSKDFEDDSLILANYNSKIKKGLRLPKDKMLFVQKLAVECKEKQNRIQDIQNQMQEIRAAMMENDKSFVIVTRTIFPGVMLAISDLTYTVKEKRSYCKIKKQEGEIKFLGM